MQNMASLHITGSTVDIYKLKVKIEATTRVVFEKTLEWADSKYRKSVKKNVLSSFIWEQRLKSLFPGHV